MIVFYEKNDTIKLYVQGGNYMAEWWGSYTAFQQVMFIIASTATIIMIIFLILMLFGIHGEEFDGADVSSFDHDLSGDDLDASGQGDLFNDEPLSAFSGLRLLTLRGILAFLSVGGWVALLMNTSAGIFWSIFVGILSGATASFLLALAFKQAMRLESVGNVQYVNAIGKKGSVYIKIPANFAGKGKINLTLQERFVEVDAMTNDESDLKPGTSVIVTGLKDETTLIVKKDS